MKVESPSIKRVENSRHTVRLRLLRCAVMIVAAVAADGCAHHDRGSRSSPPPSLYAPEAQSDHGMVSTGSTEATRVAVQILELGGNAVDAAVAAAFALGVSDPGGSGLGGMTMVEEVLTPAEARRAGDVVALRVTGWATGKMRVGSPAGLLVTALARLAAQSTRPLWIPNAHADALHFALRLPGTVWVDGPAVPR